MRDMTKAIAGLTIFVVLVTYPVWHGIGRAGSQAAPNPQLPAGGGRCVEGKQWMAANHMVLLRQWRDAVVRGDGKEYVSKTYADMRCEMSLSKTCMRCHTNQQEFCARCHNYANVELTCWNCHQDAPGRNRLATTQAPPVGSKSQSPEPCPNSHRGPLASRGTEP